MSKRNRREHGRIISVETLTRGDALALDAAAGATEITVNDAGDFDEDGGWLYIGAQTVEYTACDDDTGVITLASALTAAGEQGDPVQVWSDLYDEVVDYQLALVELDGEYDNPDPVVAEVAEGVGDLPEGDRGKAGESCTLKRVADDEWEVVGVGGRPRKSRGLRAEADDFYVITAADVAAGVATVPLSHRPAPEWLVLWWRTVAQEPTEYTINYDAQTITYPLDGFEKAGDRIWVHYAYRKGLKRDASLPFGSTGWKYLQIATSDATNRSGTAFDDSSWATGEAPFADSTAAHLGAFSADWLIPVGHWDLQTSLWLRRNLAATPGSPVTISVRIDTYVSVYWNGTLVGTGGTDTSGSGNYDFTVPGANVLADNVLAVRASDDSAGGLGDRSYVDVEVLGAS